MTASLSGAPEQSISSPARIDVHTHGIPRSLPTFATRYAGSWPELVHTGSCTADLRMGGTFYRALDSRCWDPQARLAEMAEDQVAAQVVSPIPITFAYQLPAAGVAELARAQNDWLGEIVRASPRQFIGLGSVPLQEPQQATRLTIECMNDLGLKGIEIGSNVNGQALDDDALGDFFAACEETGAVVFVHPWNVLGQERLTSYGLASSIGMPAETAAAAASLILGGVLDRHPALRVVLAHGGGTLLATLPRIERCLRLPGVTAPALPLTAYLTRFWYDSLVYDPGAVRALVAAVGSGRVMVGSDYPFGIGERPAGEAVLTAGLAPGDERAVLYDTAAALFGVEI